MALSSEGAPLPWAWSSGPGASSSLSRGGALSHNSIAPDGPGAEPCPTDASRARSRGRALSYSRISRHSSLVTRHSVRNPIRRRGRGAAHEAGQYQQGDEIRQHAHDFMGDLERDVGFARLDV